MGVVGNGEEFAGDDEIPERIAASPMRAFRLCTTSSTGHSDFERGGIIGLWVEILFTVPLAVETWVIEKNSRCRTQITPRLDDPFNLACCS